MRILIAPDSFKGSLTSLEAATVMEKAIVETGNEDRCVLKPMADGGEGTIDAFLASVEGERVPITCAGPLGVPIETSYAILTNRTAVIEVASIAGLVQVPQAKRNPDVTTTYGIGEAIRDALDKGCRQIIIGLGGSATNDAGLGMLLALGMKAWSDKGESVKGYGGDLFSLAKVDFSQMDIRLKDVHIKVACDVDNPLTGSRGASAIYGPQKGATTEQVKQYDQAHANFAKLIDEKKSDAAGAGAAGGLGFALLSMGATLEPGAHLLAEVSRLEEDIKQVDLVLTGEGQSDEQTLYGKAPAYIADLARKHGKPTVLISGSLGENSEALHDKFAGCFSIVNRPVSLEYCMEYAEELLYIQTKHIIHTIRSLK